MTSSFTKFMQVTSKNLTILYMSHAEDFKENRNCKESYNYNKKDRSEISSNPKQNETLTRRIDI